MTAYLELCNSGVAMHRSVVTSRKSLVHTGWMQSMQDCGMQHTKYWVVTIPLRSAQDVGRLAALQSVSKFVTLAIMQLVFLNPRTTAKEEVTKLMYAGTNARPTHEPSVGVEFIFPCKPGTEDPNPTTTPLDSELVAQCVKALRTLRSGGRVPRLSLGSSHTVSPDAPVPKLCTALWSRVVSCDASKLNALAAQDTLQTHVTPDVCRNVLSAIVYLSSVMTTRALPGPQFTSRSLTVQEADTARDYEQASKSLSIDIDVVPRRREVLTEIKVNFPFFTGVSVHALSYLQTMAAGEALLRVDGMTGVLTLTLMFRKAAQPPAKRQRTTK